ncbi:MAG: hypothetical protein EHM85_10670 [Desulfobacteraceae bacterium]|nr:MAG: hypothetical protein EHM85_10670 [Desulfobacteraceae bacterium]
MIAVTGIGWLNRKEYGCVIGNIIKRLEGLDSLYTSFKRESIFSYPVKNFSRFDAISKTTCFCAALALKDAGIYYSAGQKQDIGIFGANESGCLESNINYFKDYIESGRILARGNLFIYTLPSIPLAEAAIHFGLSGPLLHISFNEKSLPSLLSFAGKSILEGEAPAILAVQAEETDAVCFVLQSKDAVSSGKSLCLEAVSSAAEKTNFPEIITALTGLGNRDC